MRGTWRRLVTGAACAAACTLIAATAWAQKTPTPLRASQLAELPYAMNGIVSSVSGNGGASGSGVVVRHPRVVLSAAHVVFDEDAFRPWRTDNRFYPRWHNATFPPESRGIPLAGYRYFTSYSRTALKHGINDRKAFASDVVAHYAYENLADGFANAWKRGVAPLRDPDRRKLVVGYPSGRYSNGDSRRFKMHATGPFRGDFSKIAGRYMAIGGVDIGTGNSGGPIYAEDGDGNFIVAGIYVAFSSAEPSIGVRAVDGAVWKLVKKAVPDSEKPTIGFSVVPAEVDTRKVAIQGFARDDVLVEQVKFRVRREGSLVHGWKTAELAGPIADRTWVAHLRLKTPGVHQIEVRASDSKNSSAIAKTEILRF